MSITIISPALHHLRSTASAGKVRPHALRNPKASKAAKKKASVAMARQMAADLWRWRTGRVQPEALGWTMVGA